MASKLDIKKLDGQVGDELDQLEEAAGVTAESLGVDPGGVTEDPAGESLAQDNGLLTAATEYTPIVRKQANRLLRLFQLPPGHEGRAERIAEYQLALSQNGVKNPPVDIETAYALIREVGEYNG